MDHSKKRYQKVDDSLICPDETRSKCPFKGGGRELACLVPRQANAPLDCHLLDCPRSEVEETINSLCSLHQKAGSFAAMKMIFMMSENSSKMALSLAILKMLESGRAFEEKDRPA